LKQVRQNKGAPGIDGMTVDELPDYLRHHWLEIRAQLRRAVTNRNLSSVWTSEARRENSTIGHSHGVGPLHPTSHRASCLGAMGTPFSSAQLRLRPQRSAHQAVREVQACIGKAMAGWWTWICKRSLIDQS